MGVEVCSLRGGFGGLDPFLACVIPVGVRFPGGVMDAMYCYRRGTAASVGDAPGHLVLPVAGAVSRLWSWSQFFIASRSTP